MKLFRKVVAYILYPFKKKSAVKPKTPVKRTKRRRRTLLDAQMTIYDFMRAEVAS